MTIEKIIQQLSLEPDKIEFNDVIAAIHAAYDYTPAAFKNGELENTAGENEGSCKIFHFAHLNNLDETSTLACFGAYYRNDVLANPESDDHQNIRQFMQSGWGGIEFENDALSPK